MVVKLLQRKSDSVEGLIEIINELENSCQPYRVSEIKAHWGGEFRNEELAAELRPRGATLKETMSKTRLIDFLLKQISVASFRSYYVMLHGCFLTCFLTLWFCFITTPLRSLYLVL